MSIKTSLSPESIREVAHLLHDGNAVIAKRYPGESGRRQPVHTVYGGAHLFQSDTAARLGKLALRALEDYAPDPAAFSAAIGLPGDQRLAETIYERVTGKLHREPVEDFRLDFEDGYGNRPDEEEDGHANSAAHEVAKGLMAATLPPFIGIRIKPFTSELRDRSIRTLDVFLTTLAQTTGGKLPENFVVTLPKVTFPGQVNALAELFEMLEFQIGLAPGALKLEIMIETTQAILNGQGQCELPRLVDASKGRCVAAHFGVYDYTAACNITAAHQHMAHPACDFARHMMQVALAGTGVWLSDGATNIMPVPIHRAADAAPLTVEQLAENRAAVHRAWKLQYNDIHHSLSNAFYQGWDLHPAQLPARYAAVYAFFLSGLQAASERLRNFVAKAAQATLAGDVFDDAATGQGLLNYFLRAMNCQAITEEEALPLTGLTVDELRLGSFTKILKNHP